MNLDDINIRLDYTRADYQYEKIIERIYEFEQNLDDTQEIALLLASFGEKVLMQVTDIGYNNPSLIVFYGFVNDMESVLIQHVNQLSFLITSVKKKSNNKPAKRIGFISDDD